MKDLKNWIALVAALISLVAAIISLFTSLSNTSRLDDQERTLEAVLPCRVQVRIAEPEDGDLVRGDLEVHGTSSIDERCRFVYLFVHRVSSAAWEVMDIVQVGPTGDWRGHVDLHGVPIGAAVKIHVRVTRRGDTWQTREILGNPPAQGTPSNIVEVRRQ
jgi:hypothetical protein